VVCRSHYCIKRLAEKKRALKHTLTKKLYMSASFLQLPRSKSAPEDQREEERPEKWYYKKNSVGKNNNNETKM
jgi:hypothetical protein